MQITVNTPMQIDPVNFDPNNLTNMSNYNLGLMIEDLKRKAEKVARENLMIDVPEVCYVRKCILDLTLEDIIKMAVHDPMIFIKIIKHLQQAIKNAKENGLIIPSVECTCPACNGSGIISTQEIPIG